MEVGRLSSLVWVVVDWSSSSRGMSSEIVLFSLSSLGLSSESTLIGDDIDVFSIIF